MVSYNGKSSRLLRIKLGVFQGSILGPILFAIFINDLSRLALRGEIFFFADDCTLIITADNYEELEIDANCDLFLIQNWLQTNRLILNVLKSNYLIVNLNHRNVQHLNLFISNERLVRVSNVKILGVIFDDRLVFDEHMNHISKKMRQRIGLLSRLRHILPEKTLIVVYNAIVLPILDYSLILWGFTYNSHIDRLEKLQKRAIRVMSFSGLDANSDLIFKRMGIMTLKERLLFNSLIYIYRALNSLSSFNSKNYFKVKSHRSGTRASNHMNLEIPFTRLTVFTNSVFVKGCKN